MSERVCAVVVTYNRRALLHECLLALQAQMRPVDEILVVNNASTDGTREFLTREFPQVQVLNLPKNIGGAGGFHEGMKWAYEKGFDWIWVMDDDTIVEPDSLRELFTAYERFEEPLKPCLLASKVVWTDGSMHSMNIPGIKHRESESLLLAARKSTVSIRATTFVSLLMHRTVVEQYGLPYADYFIWCDDVEYTARVLRDNLGVLVPTSVVTHKTATKHTAVDAAPSRFYYHVRNGIWTLIRSNAFSRVEKAKQTPFFLGSIGTYLIRTRFNWRSLWFIGAGVRDGVFRHPKQ